MKKIHVVCPTCNKSKRIKVPPEIFQVDEGSLLKLPIRRGQICEHQFALLIDYNFSIRDYEVEPELIEGLFEKSKKDSDYSIFDFIL